jgi:hypothetical protein
VKEWLPQFERLERFLPEIKALDARIATSPNDAGLLLDRARLFTMAERPLLALDDCEHAMKLEPASMRARIQTGEALLDVKRDEDAAKLQVSAALARTAGTRHVGRRCRLGNEDVDPAEPRQIGPLAARAGIARAASSRSRWRMPGCAATMTVGRGAFEAAQDLDGGTIERSADPCGQATELNRTMGRPGHSGVCSKQSVPIFRDRIANARSSSVKRWRHCAHARIATAHWQIDRRTRTETHPRMDPTKR